jgi:TIR domain-containing protein
VPSLEWDMRGSSLPGVFLSYRREDAGPYARSLQLQLSQRLPDTPIFMDLDSIEPGLDFAEVIEDAVNSCALLVALIGRQWATLTDEDGLRRLDNPHDYVRFEVKTALRRGVRVIPVLIDGAKPLRQQDLPPDLHKLARLNAHKLSYDRYPDDSARLVDLIQRVLAAPGELAEAGRKAPEEVGHHAAEDVDRQSAEEADRQAQQSVKRRAWRGVHREARKEGTHPVRDKAELKELEQLALLPWKEDGDPAGARDRLAALVPVFERALGPEHPDTLAVRVHLAESTGAAGDAAGARAQFLALVPVFERVLGVAHKDTRLAHLALNRWVSKAVSDEYAARRTERHPEQG